MVRVRGSVSESFARTQLGSVTALEVCPGEGEVTTTVASLPVADLGDWERLEGMAVTFPQDLTISEYFDFGRFNETVLTDGRQMTPTAVFDPGSPEAADLLEENLRGRIMLDDGRGTENPDPAYHPDGEVFDLDHRFRGGDTVAGITGVLDFAFGEYRVQPTALAEYTEVNARPAEHEEVGGNVEVASFNVLNYFTTLTGPDARGANTPEEFERQRDKIIAAITEIDADVVGLIEIENNDEALQDLVDGLNAATEPGRYDYIETGVIGTDVIKVAFAYQPARVTPVGDHAILDSTVDPRFLDDYNRPALAQTFRANDTGGLFTTVVNHLKSKGSDCEDVDDPDTGDGAGNCNLTRTAAAEALVDWLAGDPTGSGDDDFLIIGDLNSYDKEDPIDVLLEGGYTDLVHEYQGEYAYSYVFDGMLGYLDHALAGEGLVDEVTGATVWHINADEPSILDYDMTFKRPAQDALYEKNAYRSSDHDPVIVGLDVCDEVAPTAEASVTPDVAVAAEPQVPHRGGDRRRRGRLGRRPGGRARLRDLERGRRRAGRKRREHVRRRRDRRRRHCAPARGARRERQRPRLHAHLRGDRRLREQHDREHDRVGAARSADPRTARGRPAGCGSHHPAGLRTASGLTPPGAGCWRRR